MMTEIWSGGLHKSKSEQGAGTKHSRRRSAADVLVPNNPPRGSMTASCSPKVISGVALGEASPRLYVQNNALPSSMSNSSFSSPTRSPRRAASLEQSPPLLGVPKSAQFQYEQVVPEKQALNFSSGHNSGPNLSGADGAVQNHWQQDSASSGHSPIPSPRNQSVLSSRSSVASLMPIRGTAFLASDLATSWHEDKRRSGHPLPLPPTTHHISSPFASSSAPSSPSSVTLYNSPPVRWQKGKLLGSGTFGNVYKGFSDSGTFCAMKEVLIMDDPKSKESVKQLAQEVHVLSRLRHPNIVQYFGSETLEDKLYIYLEYVSGGSIHKLLHEYGQFKEPVIRCYTRQILSGLTYLHSMNTVHRDIKGANILVDTNGEVKLADFGMAKHINAHSIPLSFKGSPYWMAPEVFKNTNGYNYPVDIWSLGCTVIEMTTAKPPWSQYEGVAAMFKIGNSKEIPSIPSYLSKDGQDFLKLCLQRKPGDRPSAAQLLEHPFVRNSVPTFRPDEATDRSDVVVGVRTMGVKERRKSPKNVEIFQDLSQRKSRMQISPSRDLSPQIQPRLVSSATSPAASPKLQSTGMYYTYGGFSPSPICTPLISSGSSTPLTGGYGSLPFTAAGSFRTDGYNVKEKPCNGVYGSPIGANGFDSKFGFVRSKREAQGHELHSQLERRSPETDILAMALGRVQRVLE
ncbi:hypothetical protein O6H91_01G014500 [Diphasiastrum complanatum]|uniref:Uncharacterized protein n=1 Tax=Diphasiastrum complanatum TaxID=34168 RepID=A0ACC2ENE6_DIPCM|nr:hypothetical protein O6H91_01G014500 [Diphasiastrum complanatum]